MTLHGEGTASFHDFKVTLSYFSMMHMSRGKSGRKLSQFTPAERPDLPLFPVSEGGDGFLSFVHITLGPSTFTITRYATTTRPTHYTALL